MTDEVRHHLPPLALNLRTFRGELNQHDIAAQTGLRQGDISKWENGRQPKLENLLTLLDFYGKSLDEAVRGTNAAYDAARKPEPTRQESRDTFTVSPSATPAKGDDQYGRRAGDSRKIIDLRAKIRRQIADAERQASELLTTLEHLAEDADKPGVLEQFDVAVGTSPARRRHARKNRR